MSQIAPMNPRQSPSSTAATIRRFCLSLLCGYASCYASVIVQILDMSGKTRRLYRRIPTNDQPDRPFTANEQLTARIAFESTTTRDGSSAMQDPLPAEGTSSARCSLSGRLPTLSCVHLLQPAPQGGLAYPKPPRGFSLVASRFLQGPEDDFGFDVL